MRRIIATFLLAAFALLVTTFAGLSVFGMHGDAGMNMENCVDMHCEPMNGAGAHDVNCINDCLSSVTALTNAVRPIPLAAGLLTLLFTALLSEIVALARPTACRTHRWREGIGKAFRRQILSTVILRN